MEKTVPVDIVLEGHAFQVFHHDISGVVFLEIVDDVNNTVFAGDCGEIFSFCQKAFHAFGKELLPVLGDDDVVGNHAGAVSGSAGIKFLDGDTFCQLGMKTDVGDAEAALADDVAHEVPSRKQGSRRQVIRLGLRGTAVVPAAVCANGGSVELLHAVNTVLFHMILFPSVLSVSHFRLIVGD